MRVKAFALSVCLIAAPSLGWADDQTAPAAGAAAPAASSEVVSTAAGAPVAPSQASDPQLTRWLKQAPPVSLGDDYQNGAIEQTPARTMHGEVGFSAGTGGYMDGYAAVTMPVGKSSTLGVAVEDTQMSKPYKINQRSLDVSLALGGASGAPDDCASAIRVGDHYVEPLWATRIRGSALQDADPRCVSADSRLR